MRKSLYILGEKRRVRPRAQGLRTRIALLVIFLLMLSWAFWSMGLMNLKTKRKQAMVDISRIRHAARLFRADHGRCPDSLQELVAPPGDMKYLVDYTDPWGQPYKLICPSRVDPGGVDVLSGGPDRSFSGRDTISSL